MTGFYWSINAPLQTFLEGWQLEDNLRRYPIIPLAETSFTRTPCLELDIGNMGAKVPGTARTNLKKFMVSLDGLPRVCQILTAARNTSELEILAKFCRKESQYPGQDSGLPGRSLRIRQRHCGGIRRSSYKNSNYQAYNAGSIHPDRDIKANEGTRGSYRCIHR